MEFITAEQFKEQSMEVQKIFIDWWQPSICDLYVYNDSPNKYRRFTEVDMEDEYFNDFILYKNKMKITPLLTEGQLRKFIEDKIGVFLNIEIRNIGFIFWNFKISENGRRKLVEYNIIQEDFNLLQAYWKVACRLIEG